jgi:hypothetical protein
MNNNKPKGTSMKPSHKLILAACLAASLAATLYGCASTTLEQQIAVKEPGSWDFQAKNRSGTMEYIRIYDSPGKLGWFKYEYGQKHPCNQGFQKVIKTVAPGIVQYANDPDAKSFACDEKIAYIFRTDAQGNPYEGWVMTLKDRDTRKFTRDLALQVKNIDGRGSKPSFILMK